MNQQYPETVSQAVQHLITGLPISDKIQIAAMDEPDLAGLHFSLGHRSGPGLDSGQAMKNS